MELRLSGEVCRALSGATPALNSREEKEKRREEKRVQRERREEKRRREREREEKRGRKERRRQHLVHCYRLSLGGCHY